MPGSINLTTATLTGTIPSGNLPTAGASSMGAVQKAAALTASAAGTMTVNIGGTPGLILSAITGAIYATDAPVIKDVLQSLAVNQNSANARLEDLIAKLKTAGALS